MADREKVIKGITHHKLGLCDMSGKICPYWEEEADCTKKMLGDALALVKEQESTLNRLRSTMEDMVRGNASEEVSYLLRLLNKWE